MRPQWNSWSLLQWGQKETSLLNYLLAVVLPLLGVALIYSRPVMMDTPFTLFMVAVILSAAFGGLGPAFVTTALSAVAARLLFVEPRFSLYHRGNIDDAERICWFILLALMSSSLIAGLRRERNILRDSEERYRLLAETASDAIVVIDEQGEILFVNPVAERIFSSDASQLLGQNLAGLLPDHLYQPALTEMKRHSDSRKPAIALQLPVRHSSGNNILLEMTLGAFHKHGRNLFTAIIRDITGHKREAHL